MIEKNHPNLNYKVLGNYFPTGSAGLWIVLTIVFYEGLLGGAAYVNTFYKITKEVPFMGVQWQFYLTIHKEFLLLYQNYC